MKHRWWFLLLLIAGCAVATAQTANVNGLPPLAQGSPGATPTPSPGATPFFKHIVIVIQENRSADEMFADDSNLVSEGANLLLTAQSLAFQPPPTVAPPSGGGATPNPDICTNTQGAHLPGVDSGCYQTYTFPLTHVALQYGPFGNQIPSNYDMDHTPNGWQLDYGNSRFVCVGTTTGVPCIGYPQNPNTAIANATWTDLCQKNGTAGCPEAGQTPFPNFTPDFGTCKDGNTPGSTCSPGPSATGCPTPTAIPPTPTPFPNGSPSPSPFPSGYACGLAFLNASDFQPVWTMAESFTFLDNFFQTNQGPSFPAHLFSAAGASAISNADRWPGCVSAAHSCFYILNNVGKGQSLNNPAGQAGSDAPSGTTVATIDVSVGGRSTVFPATSEDSIFNLLDAKGVTSGVYATRDNYPLYTGYRIATLSGFTQYGCTNSSGTVNGPSTCPASFTRIFHSVPAPSPSIPPLPATPGASTPWPSPTPSPNILSDINACTLPSVVFLTPNSLDSDHGAVTDGSGPAYLATVLNAIGQDSGSCGYWGGAQNTLVVIYWDDWGGWYDHVPPPQIVNKYMYGFRSGAICASAYSGPNAVDHTFYTFGSVLHTIENNFALGASLGVDDTNTALKSTLGGCYNQNAMPASYTPVLANLPPRQQDHIAAIQRYASDGAPYFLDLAPKAAMEAFFEKRIATDRACVDECRTGAL